MRVLVTGGGGFVGRHLSRELKGAGHEVVMLGNPVMNEPPPCCDIRDAEGLLRHFRELQPDACIHLAGMAFVPKAWSEPHLAFAVNVHGTVNIVEAIRVSAPKCRLLVTSTSLIYGNRERPHPIRESDELDPENLYAVTKIAADLHTLLCARRYGLHLMTARPANHIGPGQSKDFVVPSFAQQVAAIAQGKHEPVMRVGNLESLREFTDVRDVVQAYRLLIERGRPGEAYNIASGKPVKIGDILSMLCRLTGTSPKIEINPERYRPTDSQPELDTGKLEKDTGWTPAHSLEATLRDVLKDYGIQAA
jgi:GDP-4-dehydro-6-deoxy-D-mannose reductase